MRTQIRKFRLRVGLYFSDTCRIINFVCDDILQLRQLLSVDALNELYNGGYFAIDDGDVFIRFDDKLVLLFADTE
jgi:hypothetical protein